MVGVERGPTLDLHDELRAHPFRCHRVPAARFPSEIGGIGHFPDFVICQQDSTLTAQTDAANVVVELDERNNSGFGSLDEPNPERGDEVRWSDRDAQPWFVTEMVLLGRLVFGGGLLASQDTVRNRPPCSLATLPNVFRQRHGFLKVRLKNDLIRNRQERCRHLCVGYQRNERNNKEQRWFDHGVGQGLTRFQRASNRNERSFAGGNSGMGSGTFKNSKQIDVVGNVTLLMGPCARVETKKPSRSIVTVDVDSCSSQEAQGRASISPDLTSARAIFRVWLS